MIFAMKKHPSWILCSIIIQITFVLNCSSGFKHAIQIITKTSFKFNGDARRYHYFQESSSRCLCSERLLTVNRCSPFKNHRSYHSISTILFSETSNGEKKEEIIYHNINQDMTHISEQMKEKFLMDYDWKTESQSLRDEMILKKTLDTAVCIVPPDYAWDTIQRARHMANDQTLYRWPPAIRLFHPFAPSPYLASAASAIAKLIEEKKVEPFEITLDNLVIRPNLEALHDIIGDDHDQQSSSENNSRRDVEEKELSDVDRLIMQEEKKGRESYNKRKLRELKKLKNKKKGKVTEKELKALDKKILGDIKRNELDSKKQSLESREGPNKRRYEYNGPCVVTLEPDEDSIQKLEQLRQYMKDEIFEPYDSFSMSSTFSKSHNEKSFSQKSLAAEQKNQSIDNNRKFRPALPLGSFETTSNAVKVAKRLQRLWQPLSFNITDIHLVSCKDALSERDEETDETGERPRATSDKFQVTSQYECDAMIYLMGEEIQPDKDLQVQTNDLLSLLFHAGEEGGGASSLDLKEIKDADGDSEINEDEGDEAMRNVFLNSMNSENIGEEVEVDDDYKFNIDEDFQDFWFDDEDDSSVDQGATIVIGRTEFFIGEMRLYIG